MRQFQFKFYREWYDAISELSHEERAEAVLALVEYAYDGKIPEDRFIRIVTTLMRNKVDSDKKSYDKPNKTDNPANDEVISSEETQACDPLARDAICDEQARTNDNQTSLSYIQVQEAREIGISRETGHEINQILLRHYKPDNADFVKICKENGLPTLHVREKAKLYMIELSKGNQWTPAPLPDRFTNSFLHNIDREAIRRCMD